MEFGAVVALSLAFVFWCVWAMVSKHQNHNRKNLGKMPPGPKGWPVVGNIFELSWACHETFTVLARKYGPVMTIRIGSMNAVVISSKETAEEMYKGHDVHLAGRKIYESMRGKYGYDGSLIMAQYGSEWRMLRRLFASEFTVVSRLNAMRTVRECCINQMVQCVGEASKCGTSAVEIPRVVFEMAFNLIGNLIISKDLLDPNSTRWSEFFYHAGKVLELTGKPNVADFLPILRWIDPQGIKRKTQFHVGRAFDVTSGFIEERRKSKGKKSDEGRRKDYLDVLLEFKGDGIEEPLNFSSGVINVIILEMFMAGTDTTTITLEWAMAELLRNPNVMDKVQAELRHVVGLDRKLEEKHMESLPYLEAVIKETVRLHPPLPFLIPHRAMKSCTMLGYTIPPDTQVLVNVWAIGRDLASWEDPLVFKPERFIDSSKIDYKGHHLELIPFGAGRRMCPTVPLASRVLPLALGSLLHEFDWILADGLQTEELDMTNRKGKKAIPLMAIPIPRSLAFPSKQSV